MVSERRASLHSQVAKEEQRAAGKLAAAEQEVAGHRKAGRRMPGLDKIRQGLA